jgi:hypothetical protein
MSHDPITAYINTTASRLTADGCQVRTENWGGAPVLVGHRSDFRFRWMATKLHLFTIVAPSPAVTVAVLEQFTNSAMDYAIANKGGARGMQSGIAVLPCLVSTQVDPAAAAWAQEKQRMRFACMARPVVVDFSRGSVSYFRNNSMLGRVYSGHLRSKLDLYFQP